MKPKHIHIFQHVSFEPPGLIEDWIRQRGHFLGLTRFYEQYEFPDIEQIDWLIVLGGSMSANDDSLFGWMREEKNFIQAFIQTGKPVIGICLGAQVLAQLIGGRVYSGDEREIGWFPVHLTKSSGSIFDGMAQSFTPFHSHSDTFELPAGVESLAYSAAYPNQAFIFEKHIIGLQFHLEADTAWIQKFFDVNKETIRPDRYVQDLKTILSQNEFIRLNRQNLFILFDNISTIFA